MRLLIVNKLFFIHLLNPDNGSLFPIIKSVWVLFQSHIILGRRSEVHVIQIILDYYSEEIDK